MFGTAATEAAEVANDLDGRVSVRLRESRLSGCTRLNLVSMATL
jgi:hypothetical protein